MSKLFKPVAEAERKAPTIKFRVTAAQKSEIYAQAAARNLAVTEYILRMTLHRRADIRIETSMILALREAVNAIKRLHADYVATGHTPPEHLLGPVIQDAIVAILNLSRY